MKSIDRDYRVNIRYNKEKDKDIIERLEKEKNKQDFIRYCIRQTIFAEEFAKIIEIKDE